MHKYVRGVIKSSTPVHNNDVYRYLLDTMDACMPPIKLPWLSEFFFAVNWVLRGETVKMVEELPLLHRSKWLRKTIVGGEDRKVIRASPMFLAQIISFSAKRSLLICRPCCRSWDVRLTFSVLLPFAWCEYSDPAKSTKTNFPPR